MAVPPIIKAPLLVKVISSSTVMIHLYPVSSSWQHAPVSRYYVIVVPVNWQLSPDDVIIEQVENATGACCFKSASRFKWGVVKYCRERVCVSMHLWVCLYIHSHISKTTRTFLYTLPVAVAQSCSDDTAIHHVLPVLWMTSYFHIMGQILMCALSLRRGFTVTRQVAPLNCLPDLRCLLMQRTNNKQPRSKFSKIQFQLRCK